MKPPKTGIVSTKNKVLAHERENIPVVVQNATDFMAPRTGIASTKNRVTAHERAYDAHQEEQQQQNTMMQNLAALAKTIIRTPTLLIVESPTYIRGWLNVDGASIHSGNGSPEGKVAAYKGSLYLRKDGGASTTLYVKTSGDGTNTGWTAK